MSEFIFDSTCITQGDTYIFPWYSLAPLRLKMENGVLGKIQKTLDTKQARV